MLSNKKIVPLFFGALISSIAHGQSELEFLPFAIELERDSQQITVSDPNLSKSIAVSEKSNTKDTKKTKTQTFTGSDTEDLKSKTIADETNETLYGVTHKRILLSTVSHDRNFGTHVKSTMTLSGSKGIWSLTACEAKQSNSVACRTITANLCGKVEKLDPAYISSRHALCDQFYKELEEFNKSFFDALGESKSVIEDSEAQVQRNLASFKIPNASPIVQKTSFTNPRPITQTWYEIFKVVDELKDLCVVYKNYFEPPLQALSGEKASGHSGY